MSSQKQKYPDPRLDDLANEIDSVALAVEHLAGRVQTASRESWSALRRYPRVRAMLKRFLRSAAEAQSKAMRAARRMNDHHDDVVHLRQWIEQAERFGGDPDEIAKLRAKVRRIERQIQQWGAGTGP